MAMALRLTPEDEQALAQLRRDKVTALSTAARERYADLLDRLGQ